MCDKKNSILFTDTACVVLSPDFKLTDKSHVLLKVPRKDNMYSIDLKNIIPQGGLTCLFAKATPDESNLWHRRLGHVNFKTMNKLVKGNLPCIKNLIDLRVKVIRCDNGNEFKNMIMNHFYEMKGIKREFSVARTPQQNGVAERKNRTLIKAARTMLADSKLPTTFWAEAVNTACYVQNRVLVIKPHNKTPYELFLGQRIEFYCLNGVSVSRQYGVFSKLNMAYRHRNENGEINNFPHRNPMKAFLRMGRFIRLLMKCFQHYLTDMQKLSFFTNAARFSNSTGSWTQRCHTFQKCCDATIAKQEMADISQKWHHWTIFLGPRKLTKTLEMWCGLVLFQAQLNNLGEK
ncbi:ribonuclease H-like domain-containing protein [Tanacetum coccineum]